MTDEDEPSVTVAVRVASLYLDAPPLPPTKAEEHQYDVADEWQRHGGMASFSELSTVPKGIPRGRMSELVGRVASAGEQLMLAAAFLRDGRRARDGWSDDLGSQVTSRALIESSNYYLLSAAHGFANVTLRTLLLGKQSRERLETSYPKAGGFQPFAQEPETWISFSTPDIRKMREAAAGFPEATRLVEVLTRLNGSTAWQALMDRRGTDFHRNRPQSVDGGAPITNLWAPTGSDGQVSSWALAVGIHDFQPLELPGLHDTSQRAAAALSTAMEKWLAMWPEVLESLIGSPVFGRRS